MPDAEFWGVSPDVLVVAGVPVVLWVAALLCAGIAILRGPRPSSFRFVVDRLLRYLFIFPLGVGGLWAFICHVFFAEMSANAIGWEPSPFQYEVGVANLGLGLAGFYAAFKGFEARAATAIAAACFFAGAGLGHIIDIAQGDNLSPGNAGPILYTDFLTPIAILVLLLLVPRRPAARAEPSLAARIGTALEEILPEPRIEDEIEKARKAVRVEDEVEKARKAVRIEDEIEKARRGMRSSLKAGPKPEVLPPTDRPALNPPGKGARGRRK